MSNTLDHVEGIGSTYAGKLASVGVKNTDDLLAKGGTKAGRQTLAEAAGVSEKLILEWVNHVDLMRIKGVGSEYSDLLEEAGVDTVVELAGRNAENLHEAMSKLNDEKKIVRAMPTRDDVKDWVKQAQDLPRAVHH